jgi:HTH-type transcriptional regulator / antitoxin HipB
MRARSIRDFAAAVRGRRRDMGMSQAELAARAGVSRKWIYEFEAGKPNAELGLILRVFDALGLVLELGDEERVRTGASGKMTDLDALIDEHRSR